MRQLPNVLHVVVGAIALYFATTYGADALRILASPISGFENAAFARSVLGAGHLLGLGPVGFANIAAFFAALKFTVALVFMLMVFDRLRCLRGGEPDHETLHAALLLLLTCAELLGVASVLGGATRVASLTSLQFFFAGTIAAVSLYERRGEPTPRTRVGCLDVARQYAAPRAA